MFVDSLLLEGAHKLVTIATPLSDCKLQIICNHMTTNAENLVEISRVQRCGILCWAVGGLHSRLCYHAFL